MNMSLSTFYDYDTVPSKSSVKERCANESMRTPEITVTVYIRKSSAYARHFVRVWIYPEDPEESRTVEGEIDRIKTEAERDGHSVVDVHTKEESVLTLSPKRAKEVRETRSAEIRKAQKRKRLFEDSDMDYEEVMNIEFK